ncbi:tyrosine-type recombinase/integrase [Sansalvadorimonas verongulae]|uniref:tyrosine-type recombinase/integrase n=1 Tax=Sansalvadorimonas verongulae TaxID=2172824 RepID=UPI0012BD1D82|nr:tyrosine-type recombinase/integrase [Sansalvadorimonas verongulae]MTI15118.1 site-specific integrase [Sansalvadorimonas verongulae]
MDFDHIPKPKGIRFLTYPRSVTVVVYFTYRGIGLQETFVRHSLPLTDDTAGRLELERTLRLDVREATRLLKTIESEIKRQIFDLASHFPKSKKLKLFNPQANKPRDITVEGYLRRYLERVKTSNKAVTFEKNRLICENQWIPAFGKLEVTELTAGMVRDWVHKKSLKASRKTVSNIIISLRIALDDAVMDEVITTNPVRKLRIDNIVANSAKQSGFKPNPFSSKERKSLLAAMEGQVQNLFRFAFYSGLRTSELLGLTWEKVNFEERYVLVDQAVVDGELGPLKTAGKGVESRRVLLVDEALWALKAQRAFTQMAGGFVFHNPNTGQPWASDNALRRQGWKPAFKRCKVPYRNPYQTRHTYAHMMIRDNENLWWIANQMGHKGIEMLNRHYGGWLKESGTDYRPKIFSEAASEVEG